MGLAATTPIYTITPKISWASADGDGGTAGPIKTANTAKDGTGTVNTIFTAGANGSFVRSLRFRAAGNCTATVARVFVNNGSTHATAANNVLIDEITLATTTLSEISSLSLYELPLNIALPANYVILVTIGTTVSAGYFVSAIAGDY